jgi:hypothetical protein
LGSGLLAVLKIARILFGVVGRKRIVTRSQQTINVAIFVNRLAVFVKLCRFDVDGLVTD